MKKIFLFLIVFNFTYILKSQECSRIVNFGDSEICLPLISGMKETYTNSIVRNSVNLLKSPDEIILGVYFTNYDYDKINTTYLSEGTTKEFVKIYSVKMMSDFSVDETMLDYFINSIKSTLDSEWSSLKEKSDVFKKASELKIEFGKPIILEDYEINSKIKSLALLTKFSADNEDEILFAIMNLVLIRDKLIWLAYYEPYKNASQIQDAKSKNDYFVLSFFTSNLEDLKKSKTLKRNKNIL